nr:immunoglobulin light chain junction region [Macaca mulatta]
CQQFNRLPSF